MSEIVKWSKIYKHQVYIYYPFKVSNKWIRENIKGKYSAVMHYWSFDELEDATLFKLTWE